MLALKQKKQHSKAETILKMLKYNNIMELTKELITKDISQLYRESLSIDCKLMAISDPSSPLEKLGTLFSQITLSLSSPYELGMQKKIKHLLIHLFASGTAFKQIFSFIKIIDDEPKLQYNCSFEQMIRKQIPEYYNYDENSILFKQLISNSESNLLIVSLSYLNDYLKNNENEQLSQIGKANLNELLLGCSQLSKRSQQTEKVIEILIEIQKGFKEEDIQEIQRVDIKESSKNFVLKILLLLLVEEEVIVPEILKLFKFSVQGKNQSVLIFIVPPNVIVSICTMSQIKKYLCRLRIDPFKQYWNETDVIRITDAVQTNFPLFLKQTFDEALLKILEFILDKVEENFNQIKVVFEDQIVQDLLLKIDKACGKLLKKILSYRISLQKAQKEFGNSNLIEIGLIFYKIKQKLNLNDSDEEKSDESSKAQQTNQNDQVSKEKREKSIYEKQDIKYGSFNPIYFRFIAHLVEKRIPFPYILKTIKLGSHNLQPNYKLKVVRDLTYKKKFRKFMKEKYNFEMSKDKAMNVEGIMKLDTGRYKRRNGIAWPQLMNQQLLMILENKERYKNKLIEIGKDKDFKKICDEFESYYETNPVKISLQNVFKGLNDYIKKINQ